jgi:hypothetical protein
MKSILTTLVDVAAVVAWSVFAAKLWRLRQARRAQQGRLTAQWLNEHRDKRWQ